MISWNAKYFSFFFVIFFLAAIIAFGYRVVPNRINLNYLQMTCRAYHLDVLINAIFTFLVVSDGQIIMSKMWKIVYLNVFPSIQVT